MAIENEFQLFTSLRYDPLLLTSSENNRTNLNFITPSPFYMLAYHQGRMLEAAQHFDFHLVVEKLQDGEALHEELLKEVKEWQTQTTIPGDEPLKLRILYDRKANTTITITPTPRVPLSTLYPTSLSPPGQIPQPHPAHTFTPSPLTGGALTLGPTDSLASPSPTAPPIWTLKLDTAPTPSSPFTLLKTTHRPMYDMSRSRALPREPAGSMYREVILFNDVAEVTEGSISSLYFYRGGRWVTPPVGVPSGQFTSQTLKDGDGDGGEDEGELREPFAGRWGHSVRSKKVGAGGQRGTSRRWALGKGFCMEEPVGKETVRSGEGVWVSSGVRGFGFGRVVE